MTSRDRESRMNPATKAALLRTIAALLGIAALALAALAFVLIRGGAYPPEGGGSLGHVGMVIAGIVAAFLGVACGGLMLLCISRGRVAARSRPPAANRGPSA